jgi:hypothetical protein
MSTFDPIRLAIYAATRENPARLSAKEIAAAMGEGVHLSTIYGWGEPEKEGEPAKRISLARLIQFTLITRDSRPLAAFCELAGHACLPLPRAAGGGAEPASVKALAEFSDFMQENARAILDGKITRVEFARLEKEGREAQLAIADVINAAKRAMDSKK